MMVDCEIMWEWVAEGLKTFAAMNKICKVRSETLGLNIEFYEMLMVLLMFYGLEKWVLRDSEWHKVDAMEMKCWRIMCVMYKVNTGGYEKVRCRVGIGKDEP